MVWAFSHVYIHFVWVGQKVGHILKMSGITYNITVTVNGLSTNKSANVDRLSRINCVVLGYTHACIHMRACTCPGRTCDWFNLLAKKLMTRLAASLERTPGKDAQLRIAYLYKAHMDNPESQVLLFL